MPAPRSHPSAPANDGRASPGARGLLLPGALIGFGLGGFFDGILLHQILQWHHLLSLVEGSVFRELPTQILADGLFHAVMYVVAALGLWVLWRRRAALGAPGAGGPLWGGGLVGFGAWHLVDAVLVHWILVLHRIRLDVGNPLAWDMGWALVFGVLPVLAGLALMRRPGGTPPAPAVLVGLTLLAAPVAAFPMGSGPQVTAVFRPGADVLAAAAALDARLVWADPSGQVWVLDLPEPRRAWRLYGQGALLVGGPGLPAGCLGWSRT